MKHKVTPRTVKDFEGSDHVFCFQADHRGILEAGKTYEIDRILNNGIVVKLNNSVSYHMYEDELAYVVPSTIQADPTNPTYYNKGGIETFPVIVAVCKEVPPDEAVCLAPLLKYAMRYNQKNGLEDLKKAKWYLDYLIKLAKERYGKA